MKKYLILTVALLAFAAEAMEIIKDGRPLAVIHLVPDITPAPLNFQRDHLLPFPEFRRKMLAAAVYDLNYHLRKMSGTPLPLGKPGDDIAGTVIIIRQDSGNSEEFKIRVGGNRIEISGCAYHGIYELLRRLGCDWVMPGPDGEIIPEKSTVVIPAMDIAEKPDFAVRNPWYTGGGSIVKPHELELYAQWKMRHKLQLRYGGHPLIMIGGHVWNRFTGQIYKEEFKRNPEMLALVRQPDGSLKRQGPQLESTHPQVLELFKKYIRDMFAANQWPNDKTVCISTGPADGWGFSESPESLAAGSGLIDPLNGMPDVTDLQILLANQLLESMEKEFPNLYIGFYLYSNHAGYPVRYKPYPKVAITVADITFSRFHGILESNSKTRTYYRDILTRWGKLPNPKFFRGYNWNLAENFLPYSKLKIWGEDLPYYHRMGFIGVYNESIQSWSNLGPGNYLEACLLWNSRQDWHKILKKYCAAAFGAAASPMEQYYLMLTQRQSEAGQEAGSYHSYPLMYDQDFIHKANTLLTQAAASAATDADRRRIAYAAIPLDLMKRYFAFLDNRNKFDFIMAEQYFNKLKNELNKIIDLDRGLVCRFSLRYLNRFHYDYVKQAVHYSTGDYCIFYQIPNRLKTLFDPESQGARLGLFRPEINDRNLIETSTYLNTWDSQGLGLIRTGSVWYRLEVPASEGKEIGLFIGGADSIVHVWCNGLYVGMGNGFAKPMLFDLTEFLKPGSNNLLAIQVQRYGNSEIGVGGLIYPSFLFTGPRLSKRASNDKNIERILPGGAFETVKKEN